MQRGMPYHNLFSKLLLHCPVCHILPVGFKLKLIAFNEQKINFLFFFLVHLSRLVPESEGLGASQSLDNIYQVCPEGIQPCNVKNRDIY